MSCIERIVEQRARHPAFDVPLWSALYQDCPALMNTSAEALERRLAAIEKNVAFLDSSLLWVDDMPAESGWTSPWWWFRARQFTLCELERRGIPTMPPKDFGFSRRPNWHYLRRKISPKVRVGRLEWLVQLLEGNVRFGAASSYLDQTLQASQQDNEIARQIFMPGSVTTLIASDGRILPIIGDVRFYRTISDESMFRHYWLLCFSMELDSRLLKEFGNENVESVGFLVVYDFKNFCRRLSEAAEKLGLLCGSVEVDYYDEHFSPDWAEGQFHVIGLKPFNFAYQRELRIFLCPERPGARVAASELYLRTEPLNDIAGVYNSSGLKEAGRGATQLFARR